MIYKKVAILSKDEISNWKSCQHITSNLLKAYQQVFQSARIEYFQVASKFNKYQAFKIAKEIKDGEFDLVIWIEHRPNVTPLIYALDLIFNEIPFKPRPNLLVHLFGDFVLDCREWHSIKNELSNYPIYFFTASTKQQKLVQSFFISNSGNVGVMPFPVNDELFNSNDILEERKAVRKKLDLNLDEKIILYTGRISYQKNIELLVNSFYSILNALDNDTTLLIAGGWDDLLLPYAGKHGVEGSFYSHFRKSTEKIKSPKIKFLGNVKSEYLSSLYKASDLFISLSTHNDEDYGMSPAEAMLSGLPLILSNWGGYSDFVRYSNNIDLLNVEINEMRPKVNSKSIRSLLLSKLLELNFNYESRIKASTLAQSHLSLGAIAKKLAIEIEGIKFEQVNGFTEKFEKVVSAFNRDSNSPFKNKNKELELNDLYKEIYGVYGV